MARVERRSTDPADHRNWALDCEFAGCGQRFEKGIVADLAAHWALHPGVDREKPRVRLVWIGVGQPPRATPSFLQ